MKFKQKINNDHYLFKFIQNTPNFLHCIKVSLLTKINLQQKSHKIKASVNQES